MKYPISGREKPQREGIIHYLQWVHNDIPLTDIDSVFAFIER